MSSTDPPSRSRGLGRALCIVTGVSRGFGRALALELSRWVQPGSVLVLAARSIAELGTLQAELTGSEASRAGLCVECVPVDLSLENGLESVVRAAKRAAPEDVEQVLLVNNAASLGDISRYASSFSSMADVDSYLSLNVSSALCLTASVLQAFPQRAGLKRTVVNISSLCALQPFPSWVLYCTGKAARDMMFRVLAKEEPDLRVLNYSPGPLDTAMQEAARSRTADAGLRQSFSDMFSQGQLLSCQASCSKLMKLLLDDTYTSGDHIDVYDV